MVEIWNKLQETKLQLNNYYSFYISLVYWCCVSSVSLVHPSVYIKRRRRIWRWRWEKEENVDVVNLYMERRTNERKTSKRISRFFFAIEQFFFGFLFDFVNWNLNKRMTLVRVYMYICSPWWFPYIRFLKPLKFKTCKQSNEIRSKTKNFKTWNQNHKCNKARSVWWCYKNVK